MGILFLEGNKEHNSLWKTFDIKNQWSLLKVIKLKLTIYFLKLLTG